MTYNRAFWAGFTVGCGLIFALATLGSVLIPMHVAFTVTFAAFAIILAITSTYFLFS